MDLVIDRGKWLRGEKDAGKLLRSSDGKMCCLGFFSLACGLLPKDIEDMGEPQEPFESGGAREDLTLPASMGFLVTIENRELDDDEDGGTYEAYNPSTAAYALMTVNDDQTLAEAQREQMIADLFATHGVRVAFEGATPSEGDPGSEGK